jgi:hypothetical protein
MKVFDVTEENFKFRRIVFLALVLMFLDAFVMKMPALGVMICSFWL